MDDLELYLAYRLGDLQVDLLERRGTQVLVVLPDGDLILVEPGELSPLDL